MLENIKVINQNGDLVVSSREVAQNFEKRHTEVLRAIESKISENAKLRSQNFFIENNYKVERNNKTYKEYLMTRDGFSFLVMGFTGKKADEWKIKYIEAFNEMENYIKQEQSYQIPKTPYETLKLMFQVSEDHEKKINNLETRVQELGDNELLSSSEYSYITKLVRDRVNFIKSTYSKTEATKLYTRELYRAINKDINTVANVYTRSQLRKKHFDTVVDLIKIWMPSAALNIKLEQLSLNYE